MKYGMKCQSRRWLQAVFSVTLVGTAVLVHSSPALAEHADEVAQISEDGCNANPIADSNFTIRWTSAFEDGTYGFVEESRNGSIVSGEGDLLEVTVHWSIVDEQGNDADIASSFSGIGFRGRGLTPSGVDGMFGPTPNNHTATFVDPSACLINIGSPSYRTHTFFFEFDKLAKPGNRSVAKGNAQLLVRVAVEGLGRSRLGTNLHVATGPEPPDDN